MRGGQYQVLFLLNGLRRAGHESVLLAREHGPLWNRAVSDGFEVHPAEIRHVWDLSKRVALLHAHDARSHTLAAIASKCKFVVSRRVAFSVRRSLTSVWKYRRAARYLAVSHFVAGELKAAGINSSKIDIVYDAVGPVTPAESWSPTFPAVTLASSDPQKGRDLAEAAANLSQIPTIFSEDLPSDLRRASMFLYLTRSEGLGSAVLLAMRMGVPVIASKVGGVSEIFTHQRSGIFVSNSPTEIAMAMRDLLNHPDLAQNLIAAAKERISESFTVEHLTETTISSYQKALGA